jgi:hypothetical protein
MPRIAQNIKGPFQGLRFFLGVGVRAKILYLVKTFLNPAKW